MLKFQSTAAVEKSELVKHAGYPYPESCKKSISDVIQPSSSKSDLFQVNATRQLKIQKQSFRHSSGTKFGKNIQSF